MPAFSQPSFDVVDADLLSTSLHVLGAALEQRDDVTHSHCDRVSHCADVLGRHFDLPPQQAMDLGLAARFHDVGKIGIPDDVLKSARGLDGDEQAIMRTHPGRGEQIFLATRRDDAARVARIIRHHHECFDGSGYPDRLAGDRIPLESRILTIVDAYDAMTSDRPYRGAMPHAKVMSILGDSQGQHLDADVFRVFERLFARGQLVAAA